MDEEFNPEDVAEDGIEFGEESEFEMGEPGEEMAGESGGESFLNRLTKALLATEPDESPSDYPDLPDHTAHGIIGCKKVINEIVDTEVKSGTPAIVNFGHFGVGVLSAGNDEENSDEENGETMQTDSGETVTLQ